MALATFGTNATSTLSALQWKSSSAIADVALINNGIKDDVNPAHPRWPGAFFATGGILYVPNRGVLRLLPGDWVALTSTGFPLIVSAAAKTADFTSVP